MAFTLCAASLLCRAPDAGAAEVVAPDFQVKLRLSNAVIYDITYKYRLPLGDNSLSKSAVEEVRERARKQNFDASDTNYNAQVIASGWQE